MSLPPVRGSVTIITGASSGIGRAAATAFARAGARVVLASRDAARLNEVAAAISTGLPAGAAVPQVAPTDVTRDDDVAALIGRTLETLGRIDILICNAGVGLYSPVIDMPDAALRRLFEVNFHGVLRCVQAALPSMVERRSGLIQIVSSVIGKRAVPGYAAYCASKFALGGLAEALRVETARCGVRVQMIYPGLTATAFSENSILRDTRHGGGASYGRIRAMPADAVAAKMLRAALSGRRDTVITAGGRALLLLNSLSPSLTDWILGRVMMPRGEP